MSYSDVRSLPIPYRLWFIDRLIKETKEQAERNSPTQNQNQRSQMSMHERALFSQEGGPQTTHQKPQQGSPRQRNTIQSAAKKFK